MNLVLTKFPDHRCEPTPFDGPAQSRGEPVGDFLVVLFGEPVAQAILTRVLIAAVLEAHYQAVVPAHKIACIHPAIHDLKHLLNVPL